MFKGKTHGFRDVQAILDRLPAAVGEEKTQAALHAAAEPTAELASSLCIRSDDPRPMGHLADNIRVFDVRADGDKVAVVISYLRKFFWGHWVEWGHRLVRGGYSKIVSRAGGQVTTRGPGKVVGSVPARPFLRPAWDADKREYLPRFGEHLWNSLQGELPKGL